MIADCVRMARYAAWHAVLAAVLVVMPRPTDAGDVAITDDRGTRIELKQPARRVITLAPHLAEMMFEIGAGERIVGTVEWSNYPSAATQIPRIGDGFRIDAERVVAMRPDLVLAWGGGTPRNVIEQLEHFGLPVAVMTPRNLGDIPKHIEWLGELAGHRAAASEAARTYRESLVRFRDRFADEQALDVLYQINDPLIFTIGGEHTITEVIETCGGRNIFADLPGGAHAVDREAVLARDPDVILVGAHDEALHDAADWSRWPRMSAVRNANVFRVDAEIVARAAPRILQGVEEVCAFLEQARQNLRSHSGR